MTFKPLITLLSSALLVMSLFLPSMVKAHADHHHDEDSEIIVNNAQVRVFLPASKSTVGYLSIVNHGNADVTLTKAAIDGLGRVEIHEHAHVNGMMKMQKVDTLLIKAHQQLDFKPGGYHLMAFEPSEAIKAGQELKLTLYFSDGNRVFTQAQVVSLESQVEQAPQSKQHHTHH
ncbi:MULTISPECIES: copper chaperone PCu(A)C [unclassified Pseudoalteromonas]|nr:MULTISPECIES: copper chaperone PCu(A)C [unclassified Pseudoalteromonas]MDN3379601.1 copper chaperone PCu(A)C [Pseudoalteromonas sp. APC 3893]MDN3387941.1 copper chaperone PCu(A)C [Pseudoalteromonas sp. APC 4017]